MRFTCDEASFADVLARSPIGNALADITTFTLPRDTDWSLCEDARPEPDSIDHLFIPTQRDDDALFSPFCVVRVSRR